MKKFFIALALVLLVVALYFAIGKPMGDGFCVW